VKVRGPFAVRSKSTATFGVLFQACLKSSQTSSSFRGSKIPIWKLKQACPSSSRSTQHSQTNGKDVTCGHAHILTSAVEDNSNHLMLRLLAYP
jgi:hypothetical protein